MKKLISIVTPCFNEAANVETLYLRIKEIFSSLPKYDYEHIFIDNASTDGTVAELRRIAGREPSLKVILNTRNFDAIRSSFHGLLQARGDAVILVVADLQDPPEKIPEFIRKWEEGYKVVKGIKTSSDESFLMYRIRSLYYFIANKISDIDLDSHFDGFALYDKCVIAELRKMSDSIPYLRGIIAEIGFESCSLEYHQAVRRRGKSKYDMLKLFDYAMLGITSYSRMPLRFATIAGLMMSLFSFIVAMGYLVAKLLFWSLFSMGMAPTVIAVFFFSSVQLFFIGIIGEYIGLMHMRLLRRPLVVEKERINFDR